MMPDLRRRLFADRRRIFTVAIVGLSTLFVVWVMSPWAWFVDSTPTGGDMGAHVWSPKFLREELLPNFRLTGWSPDWYAGFPAFTFYMIIPSLAIVMVNIGIEIDALGIDSDFYSFVAMVLVAHELPRRLGYDGRIRAITMVFAAALNLAMSWQWSGRTVDFRVLFEPFTYNDASVDLALSAIALPLAVASLVSHVARRLPARHRALVVTVAVVATILVVPVPYGVAMKLIAISGVITLPLAAFAAGRLGGLAYPGPALMAVMTLPFLFDRSFNIYGGNIMSTMAGEFAYSMGLSIAVLYIGVAARSIETGRQRMLAASLLAFAGLTHLFAAFFALVATVAFVLLRPGKREISWLAVVGPVAGMLAAFWVLPFFWNRAYLNDMGWGKERDYVGGLWDRADNFGGHPFLTNQLPLQVFVVLAVLGAVICGIRRVRLGMALALTASMFAAAFILLPETRLWNVRILPFYYLCVYFLAGLAVSETARMVADFLRSPDDVRDRRPAWTAGIPAVGATLVLLIVIAFPVRSVPGADLYITDDGIQEYGFEALGELGTSQLNLGPGWMRYNFTGYEARTATTDGGGYAEYSRLVATMDRIGEQFGCGQSLWEYEGDRLSSYGTPMAPMLLPHWTDGCIGSMEGLYFEASASTPYHFLLQSELSLGPSRAMRDMPYSSLDVEKGVEGLRTMGVRYYMASTEAAISQAREVDGLTEIANSGPWVVFLVADQALVEGLDHLPVVVEGADLGGEEWLVPTVAWWESGHDTPLVAADGPDSWPRSSYEDLVDEDPALEAAVMLDDRVGEMRRLAELSDQWLGRVDTTAVAQVTNVDTDTARISFDVDQIGLPVLVRASYFPNWEVSGAEGPYRVAPNLMVVVPTDTSVELTYGRSGVEIVSMGLTLLGIVIAFSTRRIGRSRAFLAVRGRIGAVAGAVARLISPLRGRDALWDAPRGVALPDRDDVLDDVRAGVIGASAIAELSDDVAEHRRRGIRSLGVALVLAGIGLLYWLWSLGSDDRIPGGDKPLASLLQFTPLAVAVVLVLFGALPTLFEALRFEGSVLRPARLLADVVNADERTRPLSDETRA